jgi:hypothetical protein
MVIHFKYVIIKCMKTIETRLNTCAEFAFCSMLLFLFIMQVTEVVIKLRRQELENINHVIAV